MELSVYAAIYMSLELLAICAAVHNILATRTPQGTIAWLVALIMMPVISLPLYLVFGRNKFNGKVNARRAHNERLDGIRAEVQPYADQFRVNLGARFANARVLTELTHLPFVRGNDAKLLVDGEATFAEIFSAIDDARDYVLAEFFIVKDDQLGQRFKQSLIAAADRGCRVYLLFDEVGSHKLSAAYISELKAAGVHVSDMQATKGLFNRFQINFRNHRKIVIVDGRCALIGGLNVGDEYVHLSKKLTPWRDTHMRIDGAATLAAQLAFLEDWMWATDEIPELNWVPHEASHADKTMFILPSGPDDDYETCGLFFTHIINAATKRLWIASPYFVPDEGIIAALQLASMRGVDVRILIPGLPDKWLVKQAAMSYAEEVERAGIQMFEYGRGFLHQKVAIVDDFVSIIGTANFDNRSFRLNFEISVVTLDKDFAAEVEQMLIRDFANSTPLDANELASRGLFFRVSTRFARLFSPIL